MSVGDLRMTMCCLAGPRGGIDLLKSLICNDSNDHPTEPTPEWCICSWCRQMDMPIENVCCRDRKCITTYDHFAMSQSSSVEHCDPQ